MRQKELPHPQEEVQQLRIRERPKDAQLCVGKKIAIFLLMLLIIYADAFK